MPTYEFRLFISGGNPKQRVVVRDVERFARAHLGDDFRIEVIDVREQPDIAEVEHIMATPTLLKMQPAPAQRIVGDLTFVDRVLREFGIAHEPALAGHPAE